MGSTTRTLVYDKTTKQMGPRCSVCDSVMYLAYKMMYGDLYKCKQCGEKFQEDWLP